MRWAVPIYDDLSDGARRLSESLDDDVDVQDPVYLFFREADSRVPLFELTTAMWKERLCCEIDRAALMNAVYLHHPEYAAQYNLAEPGLELITTGWAHSSVCLAWIPRL